MAARRALVVVLLLVGTSACGSSAAGPEPATTAAPRDPGERTSVEIRQDYVDPECRTSGAERATVTVGPDQLLVVDAGSDGTVDGFRDGESLIIRWPDTGADDDRWVSVPVDPTAPETGFIQGLVPGHALRRTSSHSSMNQQARSCRDRFSSWLVARTTRAMCWQASRTA